MGFSVPYEKVAFRRLIRAGADVTENYEYMLCRMWRVNYGSRTSSKIW